MNFAGRKERIFASLDGKGRHISGGKTRHIKKRLLVAVLLLGPLLYGCGNFEDDILDIAEDTNAWEDDSEYEEADPDYGDYTYEEESTEDMAASTGTDRVEDESWNEDRQEEDSYIVPYSYDITGKWKNIGESGFGQAQSGAIIIFNGNRCNFYSPSDAYAFYLDEDRYVLSLTSLLGESMAKTVYIIDDDNIKIAGASLRRVE